MEEVLHNPAVRRGSYIEKNALGLYDVKVNNESGTIIADVRNLTFLRAVTVIEDHMYTTGREHYDGE